MPLNVRRGEFKQLFCSFFVATRDPIWVDTIIPIFGNYGMVWYHNPIFGWTWYGLPPVVQCVPLILSNKVLPHKYNCDYSEDAVLRVRTGVLVTNLTFDEVAGELRVTGSGTRSLFSTRCAWD